MFTLKRFPLWLFSLLALTILGMSGASAQWPNSQPLSPAAGSSLDTKNAKIVADETDGFHVVYLRAGGVIYRRYKTGVLGPEVMVQSNVFCANPSLALSGSGAVHVVWENWNDDTPHFGWAVSTNDGVSFSAPQILADNRTNVKWPLIVPFGAADGAEMVTAFYCTGKDGGDNGLYFQRYNGSTWTATAGIGASVPGNEYVVTGLTRSPQDGSVYRTYGNNDVVYYKRYNGISWSAGVQVPSAGTGFLAWPKIAINSAGRIMVMWDRAGTYYNVYDPVSGWGTPTYLSSTGGVGGLTAIPSTLDFYFVLGGYNQNASGIRFSGSGWLSLEKISSSLPDDFTPDAKIAAGPDGSLFGIYEYWGSGSPRWWYSMKPGFSGPTGTVAGLVRDQFGLGVTGAAVGGGAYSTVSGASGAYSLQVPAGSITLTASKDYYQGQTVNNITVTQGQTTNQNFTIQAVSPSPVVAFTTSPSTGLVRLKWTNPGSGNFTGTMIRMKSGGFPSGPTDGSLIIDKANSSGSADSYSHTGLTNGVTYYYAAFAHDNAGHYAAGVTASTKPHDLRIGEIKAFANDEQIDLNNKVVSAKLVSDGAIYIQESDRSSGIRVLSTASVSLGDRVSIGGCFVGTRILSGVAGERQITGGTLSVLNSGVAPIPVILQSSQVGGGSTGGSPGVTGGLGLNNIGLLARCVGRVTNKLTSNLWVDDGGNILDPFGVLGVLVKYPTTTIPAQIGNLVDVVGIVESSVPSGELQGRRMIRVRDASDLIVLPAYPVGTISGTITDPVSNGVVGATVTVSPGSLSVVTGAGGTYSIANLTPGVYTVSAAKLGYTSPASQQVTAVGDQTSTANFVLSPQAASITGTVRGVNNTVLVGAAVSTSTGGYSTTTNASGVYTLPNVTPGTYTVTASTASYTPQQWTNVVVNVGFATTLNFALGPLPGAITGFVRDSSNNAISGASVVTSTGGYSTTSSADGSFTLNGVSPSTYSVIASKLNYTSKTLSSITVSPGTTTSGANFNLPPEAAEKVVNGNIEGGFFSTGWNSSCSGYTSQLPAPSGTWGWNQIGSQPFNTFNSTTIRHLGASALGFSFCQTAAAPGMIGVATQTVNLGAPNASATFSVWAYHTNGYCPGVMAWNPGIAQINPTVANAAGRLLLVPADSWSLINAWANRTTTVTADSTGYVTIMVGGSAYTNTVSGSSVYIDDVSVK